MNRIIAGSVFIACVYVLLGWSSAYGESVEHDKGYTHAYEKHLTDTEDIKRTQGDESAGRNLNSYIVINQ